MTDALLDDPLPVVTDPAEPVTLPSLARAQSRRTFLGLLGAVGAGIGLAFADALASPFARLANAAPLTGWETCQGYINASTVCVPATAYFGSDNCSGSWHREGLGGSEPYGPNERWYTPKPTACNGRNAWKWYGGATTPTRRKCSDGHMDWYEWGALRYSGWSICRTAI